MSKMKMNKKWRFRFQSLTIARRITIMYGGIFTLSILLISFFVVGNAATVNINITKQELVKTMDNIEKAIVSGTSITKESLEPLLENKFVEVSLIKKGTSEPIRSSVGALPPFVSKPPEQGVKPEEARQNNGFRPPSGDEQAENGEKTDINASQQNDEVFRKNNGKFKDYTIKSVGGHEFMLMERFITFEQDDYFVQSFKMMTSNKEYVKWFALRIALMDIVGIALAVLVGKYISSLMLKPVISITQAAKRISIEDLSQRIEVGGADDEMKKLSVTFNSMIDRLENSFNKQTQFISDASHELRTPISVIQGYANLVNRWGKSDPQILQESIDSILAETEHMSTLIKKLLFLAKGDQNKANVQKQSFLLNGAVSDIAKELNVMEVKRNITLLEEAQVTIFADGDLMKQLLWIFTENAVKYTKENGNITLRVYQQGSNGFVSVSDDGAGINQEDVSLIFDRFYRADKSRNKEIPGTGLGLSIAKWIVESHDGKIEVESIVGEGSVFICSFPLHQTEIKKNAHENGKEKKNEK